MNSDFQLDDDLADLRVDSLDPVDLVMELEEEYDVSISDDDATRIRTVNDAIRSILGIRKRADGA